MLEKYMKDQPIAFKTLINTIKKGKYSHTYLFESKGYNDALSFAIDFAKALLCPKNQQENIVCDNCTQCRNIDENNFIELKIIEAEGLWIKKEQLTDLQQEFSKKAIDGNKKVYIINNAEKLNTASANSLLKFLEEPEDNIIAILIVDNKYQLLETIASRCQIITLKSINIQENAPILEKIGYLFLHKDDIIMEEKLKNSIQFIEYYEENGQETLLKTNKLWHQKFKDKDDYKLCLEIMTLYYLDVLNQLCNRPLKIFNDYQNSITKTAGKNNLSSVTAKINTIIDLKDNIRYNMNNHLLIDKLIIDLGGGI